MNYSVERVTQIIDGDTFEGDPNKLPIRLKDVYAPELNKPGGLRAKIKLKLFKRRNQ